MPWNDLSYHDLTLLLIGPRPDGGRPYMNRKRRLSRSFLDPPSEDRLYELSPEEWLNDLWGRYSKRCDERRILLHRGGAYHMLPYLYRGHRIYRQRQEAKVVCIKSNWPTGEPGCLLTISPRRTGSPLVTLLSLCRTLNGFMSYLTARKRGNRCKYLWALEPGKSGNAHIHIILATKWVAPIEDIALWFQRHNVDIDLPGIDVRRLRNVSEVQSYVMKYILKGIQDSRFMALLYLTGRRGWGASRSLTVYGLVSRPLTNSNPNEVKWDYVGAFDLDYLLTCWFAPGKDPPTPDEIKELWVVQFFEAPQSTGMESRRHQWRP